MPATWYRPIGSAATRSNGDGCSWPRGLRQAFETDALRLVFQPELNLATGAVTQLEALLRWKHPLLGDLSPAEFVPIAEHTGSARHLTSWALTRAIKHMADWHAAGLDISVAVNLSAPDIMDPQLVEEVQACLHEWAVQPRAWCSRSPKAR